MSVEVLSFGCRLNASESETIRIETEAAGADALVVVNTCAVTVEAGRQARKAIRRAARTRPGARIVVTGCGAQVETAAYVAMPEVAHIVGNEAKTRPATWRALARGEAPRLALDDMMAARPLAPRPIAAQQGRPRAFVPVQNGCDHRCTFCVIPFGRGNSRSMPPDAVVAQVRAAVAQGAREVVLSGVDITAYGRDLPETPPLGALVRRVLAAVPELPRLRVSSIDSVEADPELLAALAEEPRLMPHLHLSLQAGDDLVLKRMKRRHTRGDAIRFCEEVRRLRPDIVLGADLIAGFPTETEAMFCNSLDLVDACGLTHLHVFPYSPRPGTPAARMPPVQSETIRERAARLRAVGDRVRSAHLARQVGRHLHVMAEGGALGRTEDFTAVRLPAPLPAGSFHRLQANAHDGACLTVA